MRTAHSPGRNSDICCSSFALTQVRRSGAGFFQRHQGVRAGEALAHLLGAEQICVEAHFGPAAGSGQAGLPGRRQVAPGVKAGRPGRRFGRRAADGPGERAWSGWRRWNAGDRGRAAPRRRRRRRRSRAGWPLRRSRPCRRWPAGLAALGLGLGLAGAVACSCSAREARNSARMTWGLFSGLSAGSTSPVSGSTPEARTSMTCWASMGVMPRTVPQGSNSPAARAWTSG